MNPELALEMISNAFPLGVEVQVPKLNVGFFTATRLDEGMDVDNLGQNPGNRLLPWAVFNVAIELLNESGGIAPKGNGINGNLGTEGTPINSIEGRVASEVYNVAVGGAVFKRITPIVGILIHSGICQNIRNGGRLSYLPQFQHNL